MSIAAAARRNELRTVEWSRPPNRCPISGSERAVSSRVRRIATWRARTGPAARDGPIRSAGEIPNEEATTVWISSTRSAPPAARPREDFGDELRAERLLRDRGVGDDLGQRPAKAADVGVDPAGELGQRLAARRLEPGFPRETAQDGEPGRQVGVVDGHRQAPLEAVAQPLGERRQFARQPVGGEDELAAAFVEGIEGVEELLLGRVLALEELDVVDEQDVEVAVSLLEALGAAATQGRDELVGEALGGRVADLELGRVNPQVVGDRDQQVGLAEPRRPVQEERVVGLRRRLRDSQRRRMGEPIALADHEAVEAVVRVELFVLAALVPISLDRTEADFVEIGAGAGEPLPDQR